MIKVITTVGTSIFSNAIEEIESKSKSIINYCNQLETAKNEAIIKTIKDELENEINKWIINQDGNLNWSASAELHSLKCFYHEHENPEMLIYLIVTDTPICNLASGIIHNSIIKEEWIKNVKTVIVPGLQVINQNEAIDTGFENLFSEINTILEGSDLKKDEIYINITGGYKGITPMITIIAQLYGFTLFYKYKESEEIIYIPQFPIQMDWIKAEQLYPGLAAIRSGNSISEQERNLLLANKLIKIRNNRIDISKFGDGFIKYVENNVEVATKLIGKMVELKLMEYFTQNPCEDRYNGYFKMFIHSIEIKLKDKSLCELDFIFSNSKIKYLEDEKALKGTPNQKFIIAECKSALALDSKDRRNNLVKQLSRQIQTIPDESKLHEMHLILYSFYGDYKKRLHNDIKSLKKNLASSLKSVPIRIFKIEIDLVHKRDRHILDKFISNDIKLIEILEE